jgi:hypothetical protein
MSETSNPAEKPVNDGGGGNAPQEDPETDGEEAVAAGVEKPANQGGSGT